MWLNLVSDRMDGLELTDYAERYLVDRFSVLDGVARVWVGGARLYAMRIWLDRQAMAAQEVTAADVEQALRAQNVELPAGRVESTRKEFTVRVTRLFNTAEDFQRLVVRQGRDGHLIRLRDIARVERGAEDDRSVLRGNRIPMVGLGIVRQSKANTLDVAHAVKREAEVVNKTLPEGMQLIQSYDTSVFIEASISEVYKTLAITAVLVVAVLFLFLGSFRATLVPAVTVPVSLVATFAVLRIMDFSVNLLTLLAMILAIGMVVDDAIVVLENIYRRIQQGEPPLLAAYQGDSSGRLCRDSHDPGARGRFRADHLHAGQHGTALLGICHRSGRSCLPFESGGTDPLSNDVFPDLEAASHGDASEICPFVTTAGSDLGTLRPSADGVDAAQMDRCRGFCDHPGIDPLFLLPD